MNALPDLLRLLAIPAFGWAARRDLRTRRVPNRTWLPIAGLALLLLAWDGWVALSGPPWVARAFLLRTGLSVGFVVPLAYGFWRFGGFGGADAKAFIVIAILFPSTPSYGLLGVELPLAPTDLGVFSLTVVTNTVIVGLAYPVALAARNAVAGHRSVAMLVGTPVPWDEVETTHGRLLETPRGLTRRGLDLDALRMYLRWRGCSLADVRAAPEELRDPGSLPAEPGHPTDGAVLVADGAGDPAGEPAGPNRGAGEESPDAATVGEDPWGAEAFLEAIDHHAYGTTPGQLRDGLDLLATADRVWVSPGLPFLVPLLVGLLVGLVYGDLLFSVLVALGLV